MTQYDAGPGDRSDREWESPDYVPAPHTRRRGPTLPPWALLAIVVGVLILLCVALVLGLRALRNRSRAEPTPSATATRFVVPLGTQAPTAVQTGSALQTPSPTVVLPALTTVPPGLTEIAPGVEVTVQGVGEDGLNVRAEPNTDADILETVDEGSSLTILEGPSEGSGYTWWKVRTAAGTEGWVVVDFLVLRTGP